MIIGKNILCYKRVGDGNVSVILEHRSKTETLLFEKGVVAELGENFRPTDDKLKFLNKT